MIRLFVGLELPEELRQRMALIAIGSDTAKWVPPENYHVTVRFIGEVREDVAEDLAQALGRVRSEPFFLTVAGAGHFATGNQLRQLWLGIEPVPELMLLHGRIESALVREGLPPEKRKFKPHVTIARFNSGRPADAERWLRANSMFRTVPFPVEEFVLFSSHQSRSSPIYTAETYYPLRR